MFPLNFFLPRISLPDRYEGALKQNSLLNNMEILFKDQLNGPKSWAVGPNGDLFTGSGDGRIYRISGSNAEILTTMEGGRPLGVRFDSKGFLYTIDAHSGLYQIDINSKKAFKLLGLDGTQIDGLPPSKFFDDLVVVEGIGKDGGSVVFFSDVSTKFTLDYWVYIYLEPDPTGKIVSYDINAKKASVVLDHLCFPNGVEVNDDKSAILVCELAKR